MPNFNVSKKLATVKKENFWTVMRQILFIAVSFSRSAWMQRVKYVKIQDVITRNNGVNLHSAFNHTRTFTHNCVHMSIPTLQFFRLWQPAETAKLSLTQTDPISGCDPPPENHLPIRILIRSSTFSQGFLEYKHPTRDRNLLEKFSQEFDLSLRTSPSRTRFLVACVLKTSEPEHL